MGVINISEEERSGIEEIIKETGIWKSIWEVPKKGIIINLNEEFEIKFDKKIS